MITGNKGEWSEVYTFLKLLSEGKVYAGDKNLKKIDSIYYIILEVLKNISDEKFVFSRQKKIRIINANTKEIISEFNIEEFEDNSSKLFQKIKSASGRSFSVPEIEKFLSKMKISSIKARSLDKTDIKIVVHDPKVNTDLDLGFSIKSQLGSPSTLFNAGRTTNFVYKLTKNLSNDNINLINKTTNFKEKIKIINSKGAKLEFITVDRDNFGLNLQIIDTMFPKIISTMLYYYYSEGINRLDQSVKKIEKLNPLKFNQKLGHKYYGSNVKSFLTAVALGMTPAKPWSGVYQAKGGYLIVKKDGEILCYHIYHKDQFEEYLLANTKFETPSTTKYKFGEIYEEKGEQFFKLNLQIRFIK